ncbi:MAG: DUF2220 domain-containing protein [Tissierellaceae bacterium]|nr:DUF2220 domain-containing protein [Tissierellaceae bacterium]
MDKVVGKFLGELRKKNRKRFNLLDLEGYVINILKGESNYLKKGGYISFSKSLVHLRDRGVIKEIKSSDYNGLNPPLKLKWELMEDRVKPNWDKSRILKYSDLLDLTYYINNPLYQTEMEWAYVENIYEFLKLRDTREWASLEERSLELFYDEKFLTKRKESLKGKYGILKRLKLSHEDLKMKRYGEMFIYWNRGTKEIKNVIILENHSTFFSYKRIAEKGKAIYGFHPDLLIYGEGKKIESSFSFMEEIADMLKVKVLYFGDIDSEGFGIYARLRERYKDVDIGLQSDAYVDLVSLCHRDYPSNQRQNPLYLDCFLEEMESVLSKFQRDKLVDIWDKGYRIPQELINYEYLLRVIS